MPESPETFFNRNMQQIQPGADASPITHIPHPENNVGGERIS